MEKTTRNVQNVATEESDEVDQASSSEVANSAETIDVTSSDEFLPECPRPMDILTNMVGEDDSNDDIVFLASVPHHKAKADGVPPLAISASKNPQPKFIRILPGKRNSDHISPPPMSAKQISTMATTFLKVNTSTPGKLGHAQRRVPILSDVVISKQEPKVQSLLRKPVNNQTVTFGKNEANKIASSSFVVSRHGNKTDVGQNAQDIVDISEDEEDNQPLNGNVTYGQLFGIYAQPAANLSVLLPSKFILPQKLICSDFAIPSKDELYDCIHCDDHRGFTLTDIAIHYFKAHFQIAIFECPLCNAFITIDEDILRHHLRGMHRKKDEKAIDDLLLRAIEHPDL